MLSKEQLRPLAKVYFNDEDRTEIFATQDKQFFYSEWEAKKYCAGRFLFFKFTREDFTKKKLPIKTKKSEVK